MVREKDGQMQKIKRWGDQADTTTIPGLASQPRLEEVLQYSSISTCMKCGIRPPVCRPGLVCLPKTTVSLGGGAAPAVTL